MSNNKQSSIEWFKKELESYGTPERLKIDWKTFDELFEQAKAMHKEDMIGLLKWMNEIAKTDPMRLETDNDDIVDMYYNETFGGEQMSKYKLSSVYAVTGVHHGAIVTAKDEKEAIEIFQRVYDGEEIICVKDITNYNLENL